MAYRIAGIDVQKKMLAVVVADVEGGLVRRAAGRGRVMESTEQHWKPVRENWNGTGGRTAKGVGPMSGALHLAQAQSNREPRGRKKDVPELSGCEAARVSGADLELCAPIPNSDCGAP